MRFSVFRRVLENVSDPQSKADGAEGRFCRMMVAHKRI